MERQNFVMFTIWSEIYEVKIWFRQKCSLYGDVHYIEYTLYGELTVLQLIYVYMQREAI